jgi:hypothetical protein
LCRNDTQLVSPHQEFNFCISYCCTLIDNVVFLLVTFTCRKYVGLKRKRIKAQRKEKV